MNSDHEVEEQSQTAPLFPVHFFCAAAAELGFTWSSGECGCVVELAFVVVGRSCFILLPNSAKQCKRCKKYERCLKCQVVKVPTCQVSSCQGAKSVNSQAQIAKEHSAKRKVLHEELHVQNENCTV